MGLSIISSSTIAEQASEMLILALQPKDLLDSAKQKEKTQYIHARNRIIRALTKALESADPKIQSIVEEKIKAIKEFFESIGGSKEHEIQELGCFSVVQKAIEGPIPASILLGFKPDAECTAKEMQEKQSQKELRDLILKKTLEKLERHPIAKQRFEEMLMVCKN